MLGGVGLMRSTLDRDVSQAETELARRCLADSRDALLTAVAGRTDAQWRFKPRADAWSLAEVVEHLAVLEELFHARIIVRLLEAPLRPALVRPALSGAVHAVADARVLSLTRDPGATVVAPGRPSLAAAAPRLVPTGRVPHLDALDRYIIAREQTAVFLRSTPDLRRRLHDQPALGPLDGYQWVLFVAAHTERHIAQILRLKRDFDHALHVPGVFDRDAGHTGTGGGGAGRGAAASRRDG